MQIANKLFNSIHETTSHYTTAICQMEKKINNVKIKDSVLNPSGFRWKNWKCQTERNGNLQRMVGEKGEWVQNMVTMSKNCPRTGDYQHFQCCLI